MIFACYNIKGGVGKTAACVNLAYLSAKSGKRTLICDLDPQGSTTFYFRVRPPKKLTKKSLVRGGKKIDKSIRETDFEGLHLLPADLSYRNLDITLNNTKKSKKRLRSILKPFLESYDNIFLDCPPNITLLSENVFRAADRIIVPLIPTTLSRITYEKIIDFFRSNKLSIEKISAFYSMVEKKKSLHRQFLEGSSRENGFLKTSIPYNTLIERMGVYRAPVVFRHPGSTAAKSYVALWNEISNISSE